MIDEKGESSSDEELSENANLQETYNKQCKIATKNAMTVEVSLKKIELEKKNLLIKLFDTNELLNDVKIENVSLVEKAKELESVLSVTREQLGKSSSSKLDEMLDAQKSSCDKTSLGYVEYDYISKNSSTKFVISAPMSFPKSEERVHKKEFLATTRIRVDLSDTKPKLLSHLVAKKQNKPHPQWSYHVCGEAGHTVQTIPSCMLVSKQLRKSGCPKKHKIL